MLRRTFFKTVGAVLALPCLGPLTKVVHAVVPLDRFVVWTGAISGDWYDPKNWRPRIVPRLKGATIVVDAGPGGLPLLFPEGAELDTLYVKRGSVGYAQSGYATIETAKDYRPMTEIRRDFEAQAPSRFT